MAIVTIKLKEYKKNASPTENAIINYILDKPEETSRLTVHQLAEKTYTSASSIIRLCKKNGFSGYKEFIKEFISMNAAARELNADYRSIYKVVHGQANTHHGMIFFFFSLEDKLEK